MLYVVLRTVKTSDSSADKPSIKSDPGLSSWPGPRRTARIVVLLEQ